MINHFLATLDNDPTAPDGVIWPEFTARTLTPTEISLRGLIIGVGLSREQRFARCLQLVNLVEESPLAPYLTAVDTRITYSKQALRERFSLSGVVVQYTGNHDPAPTLNLVRTDETPEIASYSVTVIGPTDITITDDLGVTVAHAMFYSGGMTGTLDTPDGKSSIIISAVAPDLGDSWNVSYQKPGANWVPLALERSLRSNPKSLMTPDVIRWYERSLISLDRLAAIVVALGYRP